LNSELATAFAYQGYCALADDSIAMLLRESPSSPDLYRQVDLGADSFSIVDVPLEVAAGWERTGMVGRSADSSIHTSGYSFVSGGDRISEDRADQESENIVAGLSSSFVDAGSSIHGIKHAATLDSYITRHYMWVRNDIEHTGDEIIMLGFGLFEDNVRLVGLLADPELSLHGEAQYIGQRRFAYIARTDAQGFEPHYVVRLID
jgi:hypothetical protein